VAPLRASSVRRLTGGGRIKTCTFPGQSLNSDLCGAAKNKVSKYPRRCVIAMATDKRRERASFGT